MHTHRGPAGPVRRGGTGSPHRADAAAVPGEPQDVARAQQGRASCIVQESQSTGAAAGLMLYWAGGGAQ